MRWRQSLDPAGFGSLDRIIPATGKPRVRYCSPRRVLGLFKDGRGGSWRKCRRKGWGQERRRRPTLGPEQRVVMLAGGAVGPGLPAAAAAPSPVQARQPGTGHLFRPISADDEEQQPTEIESLCMNCYRNVRRGRGHGRLEGWSEEGRSGGRRPGQAGPVGDPEARHARGSVDGGWGFHWFFPCLLLP